MGQVLCYINLFFGHLPIPGPYNLEVNLPVLEYLSTLLMFNNVKTLFPAAIALKYAHSLVLIEGNPWAFPVLNDVTFTEQFEDLFRTFSELIFRASSGHPHKYSFQIPVQNVF